MVRFRSCFGESRQPDPQSIDSLDEYLANRRCFGAFSCATVRDQRNRKCLTSLPSKIALFEGADDGIRTHTPLSRERILSPLRLPFRHIGAVTCILSFFQYRRKWISL